MTWYRSLYWRIAVAFIACLALLLMVQGFLFVWMMTRAGSTVPNQPPERFAQTIAIDVSQALERDPALAGRVHLLGRIGHVDMQRYMRSADLFVLGSHREGSGCALMEAMACGLPPVVTDIPSVRALTGGGEFCRLWKAGDPQSLCDALVSIGDPPALRAAARSRFDSTVSFEAIGRQFTNAYRHALEAGRRHRD